LGQAFHYDEEGFPDLLELPGRLARQRPQGLLPRPAARLAVHPPLGHPRPGPRTPEEEFAVQRVWVDRALALGLDYISPVYHPHSVYRTSPDCRVVELLMRYARHQGMATTTYGGLYHAYSALDR
jgi:hypothetical protein